MIFVAGTQPTIMKRTVITCFFEYIKKGNSLSRKRDHKIAREFGVKPKLFTKSCGKGDVIAYVAFLSAVYLLIGG
jgi:hypothetical protein